MKISDKYIEVREKEAIKLKYNNNYIYVLEMGELFGKYYVDLLTRFKGEIVSFKARIRLTTKRELSLEDIEESINKKDLDTHLSIFEGHNSYYLDNFQRRVYRLPIANKV